MNPWDFQEPRQSPPPGRLTNISFGAFLGLAAAFILALAALPFRDIPHF